MLAVSLLRRQNGKNYDGGSEEERARSLATGQRVETANILSEYYFTSCVNITILRMPEMAAYQAVFLLSHGL